jgi:hydrogenase maturation factor
MRVLKIDDRRRLALCADADGGRETVEIALVEPVSPDEWLLVHAGTALSRAPGQRPVAVPGPEAALA